LFTNGTLALQIGLQGMNISGEVITTPFTFVATAHALYWDKIRPVFCDIEPEYFTLNPDRIETLITPWTTAILAVHVFGYPCQLERLQAIAHKHHLTLLYDAAHAFGVSVNNQPISEFGDLSMFSFHATKPYHSLEGGMLVFKDSGLKQKFFYLQNFGFKTEIEVVMPGTNAKMNELQALMGIQVLQHIDSLIEQRRQVDAVYRERLRDIPGLKMPPELPQHIGYNYAYVPVEIYECEFGVSRDGLYEELKTFNIFTRRYFYPLVCDFSCYRSLAVTDPLTIARGVADRILTLPVYHDLPIDNVHRICDAIIHIRKRHT
jgi:dTDP-4-amino-4,6-dideoxygalactose transaminase